MTDRPYINAHEGAKMLGIGKNQFYALCHTQGFPAVKIGKRFVISVEMLHEWMREQAKGQDAE